MRSHRKSSHTPTLSILLVGQEQVILQSMKVWLAPLGHDLIWVNSGLEAIGQLRQRHFDMVLTQLQGLDSSLISQYLRSVGDPATVVGLDPQWFLGTYGHAAASHGDRLSGPKPDTDRARQNLRRTD